MLKRFIKRKKRLVLPKQYVELTEKELSEIIG